jgi:hypothetical protein
LPSDYHLFAAQKQNLGSYKPEDDHEAERGVAGWLITQDAD